MLEVRKWNRFLATDNQQITPYSQPEYGIFYAKNTKDAQLNICGCSVEHKKEVQLNITSCLTELLLVFVRILVQKKPLFQFHFLKFQVSIQQNFEFIVVSVNPIFGSVS